MPASCPGKKPRPGMMVGFELEFVSRLLDRKYGGPSSLSARRISVPWGKLGEDGGCYELRTLPVPAARAREVLFSCLSYLESVSARTRADDGLHVNVSLVDKAAHFRLNPLDVWMLADPRKWSLRFGRSRCWSCMAPSRLSPPDILEFISGHAHTSRRLAVNFSHFRPSSSPRKSRIEFRYPGGRNYHRRHRLLAACLDSILDAIVGSLGPRKRG